MKNIIKIILCLLLAFAVMASAVGCSGTKSKEQNDNSSNDTAANSSEDASDALDSESNDDSYIDDSLIEDSDDDSWAELPDSDEDMVDIEPLLIQNSKPFNDNFKGVNGIYQLYAGMYDNFGREYTAEQTTLEFDRLRNMGIKMIRSYYGSPLAWDVTTKSFDFDRPDMLAFYEDCRQMEKRGIEVGITPQWNLKALIENSIDMNSSGNSVDLSHAYGIYVDGDYDATCRNFAEFMRQSVLAFRSHGVNNIKHMFAFTECNNTFYETINGVVERHYDKLYPYYDKAITALDKGLKDSGLRNNFKIVAPCDNPRHDDEEVSKLVAYTLEHLSDKVDIIGSHKGYSSANTYIDDQYYYYPQATTGPICAESLRNGKEFWIDEYNPSAMDWNSDKETRRWALKHPWKGPALGATIASVMNMGADNVFLWALADQQWPCNTGDGLTSEFANGIQLVGYLPSLFEEYTPYVSWYACSLLTKYIGQGTIYYCDEGNSVYYSCIKRNDGNLTVIVTSYNVEETNIKIEFEKSVGGKTFYRHLYNPTTVQVDSNARLIGVSAVARNVTEGFYDTLPGGSVAVYTTCKD